MRTWKMHDILSFFCPNASTLTEKIQDRKQTYL